jgi:hypothetical protein
MKEEKDYVEIERNREKKFISEIIGEQYLP